MSVSMMDIKVGDKVGRQMGEGGAIMEKRRLVATVPPLEEPEVRPVPTWVKRWICARLLHKQFDKEFDNRRFPEQLEFGDLTQEVMPEGACRNRRRLF